MNTDHFEIMKLALETEEQSEHKTHKVGALLYKDGQKITRHNFWPFELEKHIGRYEKLGSSSTTVHAEMAVIIASKNTENASIYITDLPCPNCAKLITEARISIVYIDAHTHNTPLGLKIKPYFDNVSIPIFKNAGIAVYEMNEPKQTINEIIPPPNDNMLRAIHRPIHKVLLEHSDINMEKFIEISKAQKNNVININNTNYATCYAKSSLGHYVFLHAMPALTIGLSKQNAQEVIKNQDKYEPTLQPINRLLIACARYGLSIDPDYIYSSQTPTAREFVNMIGAGYTSLYIGDETKCRDEYGLMALEQLKKHNIIKLCK